MHRVALEPLLEHMEAVTQPAGSVKCALLLDRIHEISHHAIARVLKRVPCYHGVRSSSYRIYELDRVTYTHMQINPPDV